ncbi:MAG: VCBS repeat-containing protein [Bacteroidota bacterium]|nr:VCBS repeat-containing protein [Bacteroidota bacterium]
MKILFSLSILFLFFCACNPKKTATAPPLFQLMENTGIHFINEVHNTKDFNIFTYRNFYNGGGVAVGDINNDGLPDIFFTSNMGANKLYLNKGNWQFEDITQKAGIKNTGKWGTGVVMADINNDGWLDIYVCNAGYQPGISNENELYINNGLSPSPSGEGGRSPDEVGPGGEVSFTEKAADYGLNESGYTTHAAFFDYDGDGDLDCYILKNSFIPVNTLNYANKRDLRSEDWPVKDFLKGGGDKLLRNDLISPSTGGGLGEAHFRDVSKEAGIYGSLIGFGLGVTIGDVNGDHYPDIYISNDFFERDYLYINQKNGTFKEELEQWAQHISQSSMGADIADINNDGYPDIFTTDMLPADDYRLKTTSSYENYDVYRYKVTSGFYHQYMQNTLQVNNKAGKFLETGYYSGVAASDWSWGGLIFDADNDGRSDIYVCNGINNDVTNQDFIDFFANDVIQRMVMTGKKDEVNEVVSKMPSTPIANKAFRNLGGLKFSDEGAAWGFTQSSFSNGAAYGDLDGDGDLDLVVNNVNEEAFIYKNNCREQQKNNYIGVQLKGKEKNTFAIGSTIYIYQDSQIISREVIPSRGFQSSVDYKQIIGLGTRGADSMVIIWPDRTYTTLIKPAINQVHVIEQGREAKKWLPSATTQPSLLDSVKTPFEKHLEDDYVDFYYERNIPMMLSHEGPKAATADVNGDGLMDVYIGGAANQSGRLYLQTLSGGFILKREPVFEQTAVFEDIAALFFDCDGDGDPDLFVGSGGNHQPAHSFPFQNRLYRNDGKGNFEFVVNAFPAGGMNTAIAIAHDFDGDGDLDLFVGSRSVPINYGAVPQSFLYVNDGTGKFMDIAKAKNTAIANVGMVTGAVWSDVTGDGKKELVVVGEWMAPRIFTNQGEHFTELKTNLSDLYGWWQTVIAADLDGDGDQDLILGNIGENFYLQPNSKAPIRLWMYDYDGNGTTEKIITYTKDGKDKPVFLKRELVEQVASLRKQNLKYLDFANKSIQELFPSDLIQKSIVKNFTYAASCIALNNGKGQFTVQKLPTMVQLSSVQAALGTDVNGDGKIDLVLGGNQFHLLPQFSRLDASFGHILQNRGNGVFDWLEPRKTGLKVQGEVRDIVQLPGKGANHLLFLRNDDFPALYRIKTKK